MTRPPEHLEMDECVEGKTPSVSTFRAQFTRRNQRARKERNARSKTKTKLRKQAVLWTLYPDPSELVATKMPKIFALRSRLLETQQSLDNDLDLFGHKQTDLENRQEQTVSSNFPLGPRVTSKFDLRVTDEVDPLFADLDQPQESTVDVAPVDLTSEDDLTEVEGEVLRDSKRLDISQPGRIALSLFHDEESHLPEKAARAKFFLESSVTSQGAKQSKQRIPNCYFTDRCSHHQLLAGFALLLIALSFPVPTE